MSESLRAKAASEDLEVSGIQLEIFGIGSSLVSFPLHISIYVRKDSKTLSVEFK